MTGCRNSEREYRRQETGVRIQEIRCKIFESKRMLIIFILASGF